MLRTPPLANVGTSCAVAWPSGDWNAFCKAAMSSHSNSAEVIGFAAANRRRVTAHRVASKARQFPGQWDMHFAIVAIKRRGIFRCVVEYEKPNHTVLLVLVLGMKLAGRAKLCALMGRWFCSMCYLLRTVAGCWDQSQWGGYPCLPDTRYVWQWERTKAPMCSRASVPSGNGRSVAVMGQVCQKPSPI